MWNKTEPFAYIKERLSKNLTGWQGKLLSGTGKDLLIRVVAQSLPAYTMNCFMLPQHLCNTLHQLHAPVADPEVCFSEDELKLQ